MERSNRRKFLTQGLVIGAGLSLAPNLVFGRPPDKKVRLGMIGVGLRGTNHLRNLLSRTDVTIPSICDIDVERISIAQDLISKAGHQKAEAYSKNEYAFLDMLKRDDLDGVIISTPWEWHTPMAVAS